MPQQGESRLIQPIGADQQQLIRDATARYICRAQQVFARPYAAVPVLFDLSGSAAGMFKVDGRQRWIRYNPWIFAKYFSENLRDTVPYEVAHYIVHEVYGLRQVKPHGQEWQALMVLFDASPEVTFRLDLEGIPRRRQRTHPYRCACREHEVSATRHNRVVRGTGRYHCRYCDGELFYAG